MNAPLPVQYGPTPQFQLKKLTPKHRQVAALLAQGLGRGEIATITGFTPEYITALGKQQVFLEHLQHMSKFADARLLALHDKAIDTAAELMTGGGEDARLRAAQAVLKALKKDGSSEQPTVKVNFVVRVPAKAASGEDWVSSRKPITLEDAKQEPSAS